MMHAVTGEHTPLLGGIDRGGGGQQQPPSLSPRRRPRVGEDSYHHSAAIMIGEDEFDDVEGNDNNNVDQDIYNHHRDDEDEEEESHAGSSMFSNVSNRPSSLQQPQHRTTTTTSHRHPFSARTNNHNNNNNNSRGYNFNFNRNKTSTANHNLMNNNNITTIPDSDGKTDRRNWTRRMVSVLTQQIQKQSSAAAAAVATTTRNGGGGASLSSSSRGTDQAQTTAASSDDHNSHNYFQSNHTARRGASGGGGDDPPNNNNYHNDTGDTTTTATTNSYYEDTFNDQPWRWTFGTHEDDGIWMNTSDRAGTIMAATVWLLILYSILTMLLLTRQEHVSKYWAAVYATICTLALASHAKTTFTDPGAVASSAVPLVTKGVKFHAMCSICQSYKPKYAHHCRICNRCITRMDHHCPWMNNCVGAGNLKHFTLFLLYTWLGSGMALTIFLANYFFCNSERCEFTILEIQMVRLMSLVCTGAWLFTSSMLMSVIYGIITGVGTIDRLKKKATNTWHLSDEESLPLSDVVGSGPVWTWLLPVDPFFPDYDRVMGYATMQRLLREQSMAVAKRREAAMSSREEP
ncbi:hypothetical protein ACA910_003813 [Epithemia clementina (nom. ined.)]